MPLTVRGGTGSRLAGGCASAGCRDVQPTRSRRPAGLQVGPAEFGALQLTRVDPRSTVTENDRPRHSGSRWEPAAASPGGAPLVDQPPPGGTPGEPPLPPSAAAEQAPPTLAEPAPTTPAPTTPARRAPGGGRPPGGGGRGAGPARAGPRRGWSWPGAWAGSRSGTPRGPTAARSPVRPAPVSRATTATTTASRADAPVSAAARACPRTSATDPDPPPATRATSSRDCPHHVRAPARAQRRPAHG